MSTSHKLFIGLVTIVFFGSAAMMLTTTANQAEATGYFDKFKKDKFKKGKCDVPPTWGGVIPGDKRFVPTFVDAAGVVHAYCDRQTGLVWDASPADTNQNQWPGALDHCITRTVSWNGQLGGRLPSIPELASLLDSTSTLCTEGGPCLPDGNPFNVGLQVFWSATTSADDPSLAWAGRTDFGTVIRAQKTSSTLRAWCVRGAMNAHADW